MWLEGLVLFGFILVVIFLVMSFLARKKGSNAKTGTTIDIEKYISGLKDSTNKQSFLILKVEGTDQFTQLTQNDDKIKLNFPLITDEQKSRKATIKKIAEDMKLELTSSTIKTGSEFLDFNLHGDSEYLSKTVEQIMIRLFEIDNKTSLSFHTNGFFLKVS